MVTVRKLQPDDVGAVVSRIVSRLRRDAALEPLVNPEISLALLSDALRGATNATWVVHREGRIVGHLFGARLESHTNEQGVWIGPDGASFETTDDLAELYSAAARAWIDAGALQHYVWVLDDPSTTRPWYDLGFARMHVRGVMALDGSRHHLNADYSMRHGSIDDLELAVELDSELDRAQRAGPSFLLDTPMGTQRSDLYETLSDPDVTYYVVHYRDVGVAQCVTFPLPPRRGSFARTVHLSEVVVRSEHRGLGIGTAMVGTALKEARDQQFEYVETNWRTTNRSAQRFWLNYGFSPTYVRLHRTLGRD